jgi:hypothetical protein
VIDIIVGAPAEEAFGSVENVVRVRRDGAVVHERVFSDTAEEVSEHGGVWGSFCVGALWVMVEKKG